MLHYIKLYPSYAILATCIVELHIKLLFYELMSHNIRQKTYKVT